MSTKEVYVVGGGFAGVSAARAILRKNPDVRVNVVDRTGLATMVPALPDFLSGRVPRGAFARPLADVFAKRGAEKRLSVIVDEVVRIDPSERSLVGRETTYRYDGLVIAGGSTPEYYGFVPENGRIHTVHTFDAARSFRDEVTRRLRSNPLEVVIVGGGYTGLEVAASLRKGIRGASEKLGITVVEAAPEIIPFLDSSIRRRVRDYLEELNITIRTETTLKSYADDTAVLSDGTRIGDCLICWSAGMRAPALGLTESIERTPDGRIRVTEFLGLPGYPEVFVAGDIAALEKDGKLLRRAVNFSYYSGKTAGRNAAAHLSGARLVPFRPVDLGWVIPLGDVSSGRIFGGIPVGRAFGLRLHYIMCGFRHFGVKEAWEFYKTAMHLRRAPDPLMPSEDGAAT